VQKGGAKLPLSRDPANARKTLLLTPDCDTFAAFVPPQLWTGLAGIWTTISILNFINPVPFVLVLVILLALALDFLAG
jgi:hypothetical protein